MMKLQPYPEYKDSGVPWLGKIPVRWELMRTKQVFRLRIEKAPSNNQMELLSIYTHIGVKPRRVLEERGNKASTTDGYWIVKKGDIISNKLLAWMGAVGVSHYEGVTSPAYDILRPVQKCNTDYYHYLFRTTTYLQQFKIRSRGIMDMRLRLYFDQFGQIPVPCPTRAIQDSIVRFLDWKSAQINKFIRNKRRLIELLKEQKQNIINQAVTRGIDSDVKLKPSGVEWIGDIPEHWEVRRLRIC
jgi:type I restriction enzyme, S subunit